MHINPMHADLKAAPPHEPLPVSAPMLRGFHSVLKQPQQKAILLNKDNFEVSTVHYSKHS